MICGGNPYGYVDDNAKITCFNFAKRMFLLNNNFKNKKKNEL